MFKFCLSSRMGWSLQVVVLLLYFPLELYLYISAANLLQKRLHFTCANYREGLICLDEANEEIPAACKGFKI